MTRYKIFSSDLAQLLSISGLLLLRQFMLYWVFINFETSAKIKVHGVLSTKKVSSYIFGQKWYWELRFSLLQSRKDWSFRNLIFTNWPILQTRDSIQFTSHEDEQKNTSQCLPILLHKNNSVKCKIFKKVAFHEADISLS